MMKKITLTLLASAMLVMPVMAQNRTRNIYTWGNKLDTELLNDKSQKVQLNRTLFAGYNSICLPVSMTAEELQTAAKDVQIECLKAIHQEGDVLNLIFEDCTAEGLQAGVPYLIYTPTNQTLRAAVNGEADMTLQHVTLKDKSGANQVTFCSSWESVNEDGRYGIPARQDNPILESILVRTESDKTFLPTRCGFTWDGQSPSAQRLQILHVTNYSEGATCITNLTTSNTVADIYNLEGKLVSAQVPVGSTLQSLPQGVYVVNGQKVIVK